jgi:glycosyltransferase involved in cell wall biosynthesis
VVVACYNQGGVLPLVLAGFASQSCRDFEVVLADDGSREEYAPLLREFAGRFAHGIQHVRHEDRGFRKTRILNRAVRASRFESLIFSDADCVPHPGFVAAHLGVVAPGTAASGRRAHLARECFPTMQAILADGLRLSPLRLLRLKGRGQASVIEHGFAFPLFSEAPSAGILGSNLSVARSDLLAINGFNEEYEDWGTGEDTDLDLRLRLGGVRVRVFRTRMVQYHVAHGGEREFSPQNREILERTRRLGSPRAAIGLAEAHAGDCEHAVYR